MHDSVINVQHLTAQYRETVVLDDISFQIYPSEIFFIIGGSGCGKTTLLNHMIGLLRPASGKIIILGKDLVSTTDHDRVELLKKIGVTYQTGALFGSMNVLENVRLPLEEMTSLPSEAINSIAINKLRLVGLENFLHYMPAELSGGMQKRAAIARAMALDPHILFLDEPSAGLDPVTSARLDQLILNLSQELGITFVIVSHELPSIYAIGQRAIMLHNHKIIAEGNPKTLRDKCDKVPVQHFFHRSAGA